MYFRQLLDDETACASYLPGCKGRAQFAVVDPHAAEDTAEPVVRRPPALRFHSEDAFVAALVRHIPPRPEGQAEILAANLAGREPAAAS